MQLRLLLLAFLGFVFNVGACPPPLNNWRFVGNETHDSGTLVQDALSSPTGGMGWAEAVSLSTNPHTTWPAGLVRYCYTNPSGRDAFAAPIDAAWKLWTDKIGQQSKKNGHQLQFMEFPFENNWRYCYLERKGEHDPWIWNPEVPGGEVVIVRTLEVGYLYATVGYVLSTWDTDVARHSLWINMNNINQRYIVKDIAHELGHLFGLWHEHQRIDRDHYVHFECKNLIDYDRFKKMVEEHPKDPSHNIDLLCNNGNVATQYGWHDPSAFSKVYLEEEKNGRKELFVVNYDKEHYDEDSIMHYDSWIASSPKKDMSKKVDVPLVAWLKSPVENPPDKVTEDNSFWIWQRLRISDGDARAIRYLYPWKG